MLISDIFDNYRQPIIASIKTNGTGIYELKKMDSHYITSVYGKGGIEGLINVAAAKNKILFIDSKKSHNPFSFARVQFPRALNKYDFDTRLRQSNHIVNKKRNIMPRQMGK